MACTSCYLSAAFLLVAVQFSNQVPATFHIHRPFQQPDQEALKDIFVGRCEEYQLVLHPELFRQRKNCESLWRTFQAAAFATSYGCIPEPSAFGGLLEQADHTMPTNTFVFWSGVYEVVARMKKLPIFFPISKTLMGHTMDMLSWCKENCSTSDLDETSSLEETGVQQFSEADCINFTLPFWVSASQWYARKAAGRVSIVLNATGPTPFREGSIFGQYELPQLSSSKVTSIDIFLVGSLDETKATDACKEKSVTTLSEILRRKGIQVRCEANPEFILHLLCAGQPDTTRCHLKGVAMALPSFRWTVAASAFALATIFTTL